MLMLSPCLAQEGVSPDLAKVRERRLHRLHVAALVVLQPVLLEERLDPRGDDGVAELRHAGEQVVLDLEVQVAHPPGDEVQRTGGHIHGVNSRVSDPVNLYYIHNQLENNP